MGAKQAHQLSAGGQVGQDVKDVAVRLGQAIMDVVKMLLDAIFGNQG